MSRHDDRVTNMSHQVHNTQHKQSRKGYDDRLHYALALVLCHTSITAGPQVRKNCAAADV